MRYVLSILSLCAIAVIYGQLVQTQSQLSGKEIVINRKELVNGIYIYVVEENDKRIATGKAVVY